MPQILTKAKQEWADRFRPDTLRGLPLNPNAGDEAQYYQDLARLIEAMTAETEKHLKALFGEEPAQVYFAEDASVASQARILTNALKKKFDRLFATRARELAERVARRASKSSSQQLHSSIQKLSGGLSLSTASLKGPLTEILSATITENVALIKSIPQKYLGGVQQAVMRSITTGNGLADLVPYLAKNKGITSRRARFIAKDQTKKAFENLCSGRMAQLGLDDFEWLHTGGSNHPRKQHQAWSGKRFKISNPPIDVDGTPTLPGQKPGCRCRKVPIIKFA